ncbi:MAG: cytochrome c [Piscinibacter sp.]|nr:cytochrome c [Piscinibacter sp.]
MNDPEILPQQQRELPEPHERHHPMPWAVLWLVAAMAAFGIVYIAYSEVDTPSSWGDGRTRAELAGEARPAAAAVDGAALYGAVCAACHQPTGRGLPGVFPPLAGSEWVAGKEGTLAAIVLHGINGPLTVGAQTYSGAMPSFKDQLDDAQIAAVLSYLRSQWGNAAGPVDAGTVARVREALHGRSGPFAGDAELKALP